MSSEREQLLRLSGEDAYRLACAIVGDESLAQQVVHQVAAEPGGYADELGLLRTVRARAIERRAEGRSDSNLKFRPVSSDPRSEELESLIAPLSASARNLLLRTLTGRADMREESSLAAALERLHQLLATETGISLEDIP